MGDELALSARNVGPVELTVAVELAIDGNAVATWKAITLGPEEAVELVVAVELPPESSTVLSRQATASARIFADGVPQPGAFAAPIYLHADEEVEGTAALVVYTEAVMREEFAGGLLKDPSEEDLEAIIEWDDGTPVRLRGVFPSTPDGSFKTMEHGPGDQAQGEE